MENADLGFGHEVASGVLVLDEVKHLAGHVEHRALQKEVDEVEEHGIAVFAGQLFVNGLHLSVVDDLNLELMGLSPEVLRDRALRRHDAQLPHLLSLGDGEVLASHLRPCLVLVDQAEKEVRV